MHIAMTGLGSRGDVQPTVVLAAELARRGHEVSVALPADLLDFGARLGLTTVSIGVRAKDFLESEEGRRLLADGQSGKYVKGLLAYKLKVADGPQAVLTEMARDADVMVTGLITEDETACIAEARGIPLVCLHHAPRRQNGAFPSVFVPQHRYPRFVNRLTHTLAYHAEWRMTGGYVNRFRAKLGLPPAEDPTPSGWRVPARRNSRRTAATSSPSSPTGTRTARSSASSGCRGSSGVFSVRTPWTPRWRSGSRRGSHPRSSASAACPCGMFPARSR